MFGTKEAFKIEEDIKSVNRKLKGTITKLPDLDWNKEVELLELNEELENEVKEKLEIYLKRIKANYSKTMENNIN